MTATKEISIEVGPRFYTLYNVDMTDFSRITTRGGDSGQTSIADGSRRSKDDMLIDVIGEVDELHAQLGLLKASLTEVLDKDDIEWIEQRMLRIGGMLAVPPDHEAYASIQRVTDADIDHLEKRQKEMMDEVDLPPLFVTYGETESGARADVARAVCRRVERRMVRLIRERVMTDLTPAQRFLNRLSDWLFIRARLLDAC